MNSMIQTKSGAGTGLGVKTAPVLKEREKDQLVQRYR